jgi:hypothetical protein
MRNVFFGAKLFEAKGFFGEAFWGVFFGEAFWGGFFGALKRRCQVLT